MLRRSLLNEYINGNTVNFDRSDLILLVRYFEYLAKGQQESADDLIFEDTEE